MFKPFTFQLKYLYISGNKNLHQTLSSATKQSSILRKAVVPRRYPRKEDRASPDRQGRDYNRNRDRSRSPIRNKGGDRGDNSRNARYRHKKNGGGGKDGGKTSRDFNKKK